MSHPREDSAYDICDICVWSFPIIFGFEISVQISYLSIFLTCEELICVPRIFEELVHVRIYFLRCEELIPNVHICEKSVQNQIGTEYTFK